MKTKSILLSIRSILLLCGATGFILLSQSCGGNGDGDKENEDQLAASFTISDGPYVVGEPILFNNTSENASTYDWDFGDGNVSNSESPSHSYDSGGDYSIKMNAIDTEGNQKSATKSISVDEAIALLASFTVPTGPLYTDTDIQFTNTSTGADSYEWQFGDGNSSTGVSPSHSYTNANSYSVKLIATKGSETNETVVTITVDPKPEPIVITNCNQFGDLTWTDHNPNGADYIIDCNFKMKSGVLSISENTTIEVADGQKIIVEAESRIDANGAVFTGISKNKGSWKGFDIQGGSASFENVTIDYAGNSTFGDDYNAAIRVIHKDDKDGRLSIDNSTIRFSKGNGIFCNTSTVLRSTGFLGGITSLRIADCDDTGLKLAIDNLDAYQGGGVTISNCGKDNRVEIIESSFVSSSANNGDYLNITGGKYYVSGNVVVGPGNGIIGHKISSGTNFMMGPASRWIFNGSTKISLVGTQANPIEFFGEDPSSAAWWGVVVSGNSSNGNLIEYCNISGGGLPFYNSTIINTTIGANLSVLSSNLKLVNSNFNESVSCGILNVGSTIDSGNNGFSGNNLGDTCF